MTDFTDYAIVSRVLDPEALTGNAPWDWRKKNMQAALAIEVRHGQAAPARVVASYFW